MRKMRGCKKTLAEVLLIIGVMGIILGVYRIATDMDRFVNEKPQQAQVER